MERETTTPPEKYTFPYQWTEAVIIELVWLTGGLVLKDNDEVNDYLSTLCLEQLGPKQAAVEIIRHFGLKREA